LELATKGGETGETLGSAERDLMLATQWRQRMRQFTTGRAASGRRRRAQRQTFSFNAPAEVLEGRQLLTGGVALGTPYLAWVTSPSNAIAGHGLSSFTVDVMINKKIENSPVSVIDTAYNGLYFITANGPGVLDSPSDSTKLTPNEPIECFVLIDNGVGTYLAKYDLAALDVAGTYTLTATSPASTVLNNPGIQGSAVSAKFTVTPDTATDHLVFAPAFAFAGFPTSLSVSVEDQFGNVDTNVSNVQLNLIAIPGTTSTATLVNGQATFNNVLFTSAGQDVVVAIGFGGPNGVLVGAAIVPVVAPTNNN
jgi:hypothetical protein